MVLSLALMGIVSGCLASSGQMSKTSVGLQILSEDLVHHDPVSVIRGFSQSNATITLYDANETMVGSEAVGAGAFEVKGNAVAYRYEADGDIILSGMYTSTCFVNGTAQNTKSVAIDYATVVAYFYGANETFLCNGMDTIEVLGPGEVWNFEVDCWVGEAQSYEIILNTPPPPPTVTIHDGMGTEVIDTSEDLRVYAFPTDDDVDGDTLGYVYEWYCNGLSVPGVNWIDASRTTKGDLWSCRVRMADGYEYSETGIGSVTIVNAPPTEPVIRIRPETPAENRSLICQAWGRSMDADGDVLTYRYRWYRGEADLPFRDVESTSTADVLDYENTVEGETWRCDVTVTDSEALTSIVSDDVVIGPHVEANGDVNGDGLINSSDISALEALILGGA